jgi:hypothetical protein
MTENGGVGWGSGQILLICMHTMNLHGLLGSSPGRHATDRAFFREAAGTFRAPAAPALDPPPAAGSASATTSSATFSLDSWGRRGEDRASGDAPALRDFFGEGLSPTSADALSPLVLDIYKSKCSTD